MRRLIELLETSALGYLEKKFQEFSQIYNAVSMRFESALRATLDEVDDFSRLTFDDWQQTLCESKERLAAYQ